MLVVLFIMKIAEANGYAVPSALWTVWWVLVVLKTVVNAIETIGEQKWKV